jgi:hypothetical protein
MTVIDHVSHRDIYEKVGALHARMDNVERHVEKIGRNVESLAAAANMGRGAWWAATKLGGMIMLGLGTCGWLWGQLRPMLDRWNG